MSETYKTKIQTADILVFAGTLRDHYLSSRWKMFFDRAFFNTHTPALSGKQIGFILSGPLAQNPNLREILEAYTEWQKKEGRCSKSSKNDNKREQSSSSKILRGLERLF